MNSLAVALAHLESWDLQGQSYYALCSTIEGLRQGSPDVAAVFKEILSGIESASKHAAKSRLLLVVRCLECHGRALVGHLAYAVACMCGYILKQLHVVNSEELGKAGFAIMEALLPCVVDSVLTNMVSLLPHANQAGASSSGAPPVQAEAIMEQLFKPVLRIACKAPKKAASSLAAAVLDQMLAACCAFVHVKGVVGAARLAMNALLAMVTSGPLDRHVAGVLQVAGRCMELLGISADAAVVQRAVGLCLRGICAEEWQMRAAAASALGVIAASVQVQDPLFSYQHIGPQHATGLKRLVVTPAVTAMMGLKGEVVVALANARHDRVAVVRRAAAAAAEALAGLPDPEGSGDSDRDAPVARYDQRDRRSLQQPTAPGIEAKQPPTRFVAPRRQEAARQSSTHISRGAGDGVIHTSSSRSPPRTRTGGGARLESPPRPRWNAHKVAHDPVRAQQEWAYQVQEEALFGDLAAAAPVAAAAAAAAPREQRTAPARVSAAPAPPARRSTGGGLAKSAGSSHAVVVPSQRGRWSGNGGGGGAAAVFAAARPRHPFLMSDRSRVSLSWGRQLSWQAEAQFHRPPAVATPDDLDFGIQVFAKPPPARPPPPPPPQPQQALHMLRDVGTDSPPAKPTHERSSMTDGRRAVHLSEAASTFSFVSGSSPVKLQQGGPHSEGAAAAASATSLPENHIHIHIHQPPSPSASPSPTHPPVGAHPLPGSWDRDSPEPDESSQALSFSPPSPQAPRHTSALHFQQALFEQQAADSPTHTSSPPQAQPLYAELAARAMPPPPPAPPQAAQSGPADPRTVDPRTIDFRPLVSIAVSQPVIEEFHAPSPPPSAAPSPQLPAVRSPGPGQRRQWQLPPPGASYMAGFQVDVEPGGVITIRPTRSASPSPSPRSATPTPRDRDEGESGGGGPGVQQLRRPARAWSPMSPPEGDESEHWVLEADASAAARAAAAAARAQLQAVAAAENAATQAATDMEQTEQALEAELAQGEQLLAQLSGAMTPPVPAFMPAAGPMPSPLNPSSLEALKSSAGMLVDSNSAALQELEQMMSRLGRLRHQLMASKAASPALRCAASAALTANRVLQQQGLPGSFLATTPLPAAGAPSPYSGRAGANGLGLGRFGGTPSTALRPDNVASAMARTHAAAASAATPGRTAALVDAANGRQAAVRAAMASLNQPLGPTAVRPPSGTSSLGAGSLHTPLGQVASAAPQPYHYVQAPLATGRSTLTAMLGSSMLRDTGATGRSTSPLRSSSPQPRMAYSNAAYSSSTHQTRPISPSSTSFGTQQYSSTQYTSAGGALEPVVSRRGRYDSPDRADDVGGRSRSGSPSKEVRTALSRLSPRHSPARSPRRRASPLRSQGHTTTQWDAGAPGPRVGSLPLGVRHSMLGAGSVAAAAMSPMQRRGRYDSPERSRPRSPSPHTMTSHGGRYSPARASPPTPHSTANEPAWLSRTHVTSPRRHSSPSAGLQSALSQLASPKPHQHPPGEPTGQAWMSGTTAQQGTPVRGLAAALTGSGVPASRVHASPVVRRLAAQSLDRAYDEERASPSPSPPRARFQSLSNAMGGVAGVEPSTPDDVLWAARVRAAHGLGVAADEGAARSPVAPLDIGQVLWRK